MSHYFEDESALEQLLNQQLDRAKRASDTNANRKTQQAVSAQPAPITRPVTRDKPKQEPSENVVTRDPTTGRPASWLDGSSKRVQSIPSESGLANSLIAIDNNTRVMDSQMGSLQYAAMASEEESLEQSLREDRLQEMSKQRLIKLIMSQIVPSINSLRQTGGKHLQAEVERLKAELSEANESLSELRRNQNEQIQLAETKWTGLIKKLEDKLERCERELAARQSGHRDTLEELEREHRRQIKEMEESYRLRMEEERQKYEANLKRRDEYHATELESKLKMSCELEKVEDLFGEVGRSLQGSASDLGMQLKMLKETLERQKSSLVGSSKELASKTERLSEHYDTFELQVSQLSGSARSLSELLPKLVQVHHESQTSREELKAQLEELARKQAALVEQQEELQGRRNQLAEERFQAGIKESRLAEREQRLEERARSQGEWSRRMEERERKSEQTELRLRAQEGGLELRAAEMKRLNLEQHLARQRLEARAQELAKAESGLAEERQVAEAQWRRLRTEWARLSGLGKRIHGELRQLSRLERRLVCSVCLEGVLPARHLDVEEEEEARGSDNKWCMARGQVSQRRRRLRQAQSRPKDAGREEAREDSDGRRLDEETRYAELVEAY